MARLFILMEIYMPTMIYPAANDSSRRMGMSERRLSNQQCLHVTRVEGRVESIHIFCLMSMHDIQHEQFQKLHIRKVGLGSTNANFLL